MRKREASAAGKRKVKRLREMFENGYGIQGKGGGVPFILFIIKYDYFMRSQRVGHS